jgi:hypothetical protein
MSANSILIYEIYGDTRFTTIPGGIMKQPILRHLLIALALYGPATSAYATFEAHEWGTFTSLVGSNGVTQNGMYHEDESLPNFVHNFGEVQAPLAMAPQPPPPTVTPPRRPCHSKLCFADDVLAKSLITQKMETPVIYFYSDQPRSAEVDVRFPEGVITETFPAPTQTFPIRNNLQTIANGHTVFKVDILPQLNGNIPFADSRNIYSHARNVASNMVRSGSEQEKFIFYRGIGRFQSRLSMTSANGSLTLSGPASALPQAAFLVDVDAQGDYQMLNVGPLSADAPTKIDVATIVRLRTHGDLPGQFNIVTGGEAQQALVRSLSTAGLHTDEAEAMVNTWEHGYLHVPGLRLLYILPRAEVDHVLPLQITPAPDKLERVFVARIEVLLDTDEKTILKEVVQQGGRYDSTSLGRFAEPILRRILDLYQQSATTNDTVTQRLSQLIGLQQHVNPDNSSSSVAN